jgi:hypothetical protein
MADQTKNLILKLKLETDASSGAVITKLFKEHETSAERLLKTSKALKDVDADRVSVLNNSLAISKAYSSGITDLLELQKSKQAKLLDDLNEKIAKGNITIEKHGRGWNLVEAGIQRSIEKHNRLSQLLATETNEQVKALEVLKRQEDILASSIALRAKLKTPLDSRTTSVSNTPEVSTDIIGNAQAGYARQRISDEETLANRLRSIELNALRSSIQESSSIRQSNFQRELQEQIATVNRIQAIRTTAFNASLREEEAIMRSSIEIQTAIAVHGINSVQAQRARANEITRQAEQTLQAELSSIRSSVSGGRMSPSQGTAASATATRTYTETILNSNAALREHEHSIASVTERHRNMFLRVGELIGSYQIWNIALNTVTSSLKAIPKIGIELESTIASLTATTGSAAGMASSMQGLEQEANRTGVSITTLRETFRGFQASTSLAGESMVSTWHMFTNLNTVITGLHLPAEKASGIFLAMAQIFNKTKVQSEELVKQLGNLIPGAFASFAAANNVAFGGQFKNSIDLINQMKKGMVFAHETVERFTQFMADRFAPAFALASQGLNANIGRMNTSFTLLGESIYHLTSGVMLDFVKSATSIADAMRKDIEGANNLGLALETVANVSLALLTAALVSAIVKLEAFSIAFLATPIGRITAIIAGVVAIGLEIKTLISRSEEGEKKIVKFLDNMKTKAEEVSATTLEMKVDLDPMVIAGKEALAIAKKSKADIEYELQHLNWFDKNLTNAYTDNLARLDKANREIIKIDSALVQANNDATIKINLETGQALADLSVFTDKLHIAYLRATGKMGEAAGMAFEQTYGEGLAKVKNQIDTLSKEEESLKSKSVGTSPTLANMTEVNIAKDRLAQLDSLRQTYAESAIVKTNDIASAEEKANKKSIASGRSAAALQRKESRDLYKDIIRDSRDATLAIEDDLLRLEYARQDQIMSVKDFYAQKKVLQDRDYQQQIESTNKLLDIAKSSNDIASVNKYNDLLREKAQAQLKLEEVGKRTYIVESRAYALQLIDNKAKDASNKLITEQDNISNRYLSGLISEVTYIAEVTALKLKEINIIKEKNKGLQEQINLEGELAQSPLEKIKLRQDIEANKALIASKSAPSSLGNDITTRFGNSELGSLATSSLKLNSEKTTLESDRLLATSAVTIDPNLPALEAHKKFVADKEKIDIDYSKKSSILNLDYYSGITGMAANAALSMTSMAIKAYGAQSTQAKIAFAAYKVFKIAEIIMDTASLAMKLSLSQAMIPFVGIAMAELGPPMAYAMGAIQLAMVMSAPMPAAHGGLDYVPAEQTYLLNKGERVLSPNQNKDLNNFMKNADSNKSSGQSQKNVYNVSVTVQGNGQDNPSDLGAKIGESLIRTIAKQEINNASRLGNQLNKTTSFA